MKKKPIILNLFLKSTYFFVMIYMYLLIFTCTSAIKSGFPDLRFESNFGYIFVLVLLACLIIIRIQFSWIVFKQNSKKIKSFSRFSFFEEVGVMLVFFKFFNKISISSILAALFLYYAVLYFYFLPEKEKAEVNNR